MKEDKERLEEINRCYINLPILSLGDLLTWDRPVIDRLISASYEVLNKVGLQIFGDRYLKELESKGAKVDWSNQAVLFTEKEIDETVRIMKETLPAMKTTDSLKVVNPIEKIMVGNGANLYFDWEKWEACTPTGETLKDLSLWAEGWDRVDSLFAPVMLKDVDMMIEPMYTYAIIARNCHKKVYHSQSTEPIQVKYLSGMAKIVEKHRGFHQKDNGFEWINPPLRFGERAIATHLARIDYGVCDTIGVGTMVVSGISAPVSVIGTVISGVAEILGGLTVMRILRPGIKLRGCAGSGQFDMSTARVQYFGLRTHLQNLAFKELFRKGLGIEVGMLTWYRDANEPGLQACYEFGFNSALFHSLLGNHGTEFGGLACGNIFSPEQAVLDMEMFLESQELFHGFDIDKESMGLGTILKAGFEQKSIMESEHTLNHFRKYLPFSKYFLRGLTGTAHHNKAYNQTQELLDRAHEICLEVRKMGEQSGPDFELGKELYEQVKAASSELNIKAPPWPKQ